MLYLSLMNEPIVASWVKISACNQELLLPASQERQNVNWAHSVRNVASPVCSHRVQGNTPKELPKKTLSKDPVGFRFRCQVTLPVLSSIYLLTPRCPQCLHRVLQGWTQQISVKYINNKKVGVMANRLK